MAEYIKRFDAIDAICRGCEEYNRCEMPCSYAVVVAELPAADVAPVKRGEWKPHYEELDAYDGGIDKVQYGYECSLCGRWEESKEAFCNCGAKMEAEE